jgi:hypothetical protein
LKDLEIPNLRVVNHDEVPVLGADIEEPAPTPFGGGAESLTLASLVFCGDEGASWELGPEPEVEGIFADTGIGIGGLDLTFSSLFILGKTLKFLNAFFVFSIDFTVNNCRCFVGLVFLLPFLLVFVFVLV